MTANAKAFPTIAHFSYTNFTRHFQTISESSIISKKLRVNQLERNNSNSPNALEFGKKKLFVPFKFRMLYLGL